MTRKALLEKAKKKQKFAVRKVSRCGACGRTRGFMRKFGICRLCFRKMASAGLIPGVRKASL